MTTTESTGSDSKPNRLHARLDDLHDEVRRQGGSIRATQRAFTLFATFGLVTALATLLVVAAKLQAKPSVKVAVPAADARRAKPAAAGAGGAPTTLGHAVTVRLTEMKIATSAAAVGAGKTTFTVHNGGSAEHELVVLRTAQPAARLPTSHGRASESGHVGEIPSIKPGQTKTLTLRLAAGHYSLICNLPGHYAGGMHADLNVR